MGHVNRQKQRQEDYLQRVIHLEGLEDQNLEEQVYLVVRIYQLHMANKCLPMVRIYQEELRNQKQSAVI